MLAVTAYMCVCVYLRAKRCGQVDVEDVFCVDISRDVEEEVFELETDQYPGFGKLWIFHGFCTALQVYPITQKDLRRNVHQNIRYSTVDGRIHFELYQVIIIIIIITLFIPFT